MPEVKELVPSFSGGNWERLQGHPIVQKPVYDAVKQWRYVNFGRLLRLLQSQSGPESITNGTLCPNDVAG
jgi:hypothetical protein